MSVTQFHRVPLYFHECVFGPVLYDDLTDEVEWVTRTSARHEAFQSENGGASYTYGSGLGARTYISVPMTDAVKRIMDYLNWMHPGQHPVDLCFLNKYDNEKNQLGWHADDSPEVDQEAPIYVVSFGAVRELWVRPKGHKGVAPFKISLPSGSLLSMMPGMQATHEHRIPKHDRPCGERISLTYRRAKR